MMTNPELRRDYSRLDAFLKLRENDIGTMDWMNEGNYGDMHRTYGFEAIKLLEPYGLAGKSVLDIGCGDGGTTRIFKEKGCTALGTCIKIEPLLQKAIDEAGIEVIECDQSFMPVKDNIFDFVFARHILEHSIMPYFTLSEYNRVLKTDGILFVEIPYPDTYAKPEKNPNHYSLLPLGMWRELFYRAGFEELYTDAVELRGGDEILDKWGRFILIKKYSDYLVNWVPTKAAKIE